MMPFRTLSCTVACFDICRAAGFYRDIASAYGLPKTSPSRFDTANYAL